MESETNVKFNGTDTPSGPSGRGKTVVAALVALVVVLIVVYFCLLRPADPSVDYEAYLAPKTGTMVTVRFRRDALGMAANIPLSPTSDSLNNAGASIQGQLVATLRRKVF